MLSRSSATIEGDGRSGVLAVGRSRLRILIVQEFYLPGENCGGPVWAIANMVERLGDRFEFLIAAVNHDFNSRLCYPGIIPNEWTTVGKARVFYASKLTFRALQRLVRQCTPDILHLNGFFSRATIKAILAARPQFRPGIPLILAPHGEFSEGALRWKFTRKRAYLFLTQKLPIYKNVLWQASSEWEAEDILRAMGEKCTIHIAPDLPSRTCLGKQVRPEDQSKSPGQLRLVFLSRIAPKKNLRRAIEMLKLAPGNIEFDIFGPIEDPAYWRECLKAIKSLPPRITARYRGRIAHERVLDVLSHYHFFLLPTLGENFGYAILEAMLAGCPVLISNMTPWRNLAEKQAGWDLSLSAPESWQRALSQAVAMDHVTYSSYSDAARECAVAWTRSLERDSQTLELFRRSLETYPPGASQAVADEQMQTDQA